MTYKDTVLVHDSVFAKRGPGILSGASDCGANPCYTYPTSDQVLTLTPIAAGLTYTASTYFLTEAQMTAYYAPYTYFRSAAVPASIHGIGTPRKFLQRAWRKADPSVPPWNTDINGYCPITIPLCDLPVRESGIFGRKKGSTASNARILLRSTAQRTTHCWTSLLRERRTWMP